MRTLLAAMMILWAAALPAQSDPDPLDNPFGVVDRLEFFDSAARWSAGEMRNLEVREDSAARLVLADPAARRFPRNGRWTSPEVWTHFPFTELLPSWNAHTPDETGVYFEVRVHDAATSEWSPWLYIGQWGKTVLRPDRQIAFDKGHVRIDVLRLDEPADAYQIRASMQSFRFDRQIVPSIRRIAVVYSGVVEDEQLRAQLAGPRFVPEDWARDISVPFYAQGDGPPEIGGSICSPTSVSMVTSYLGRPRPVVENALAIYDSEYGMFGNWSRATQRAADLGLDAWLTRVRSWDELKGLIAEGQPVIASIRFGQGEFPSNVLERTNGHLIVIRGLTPEGDAIVNDPASKDRGERVIYKAEELARAWFGHGGVAYIIRKPS